MSYFRYGIDVRRNQFAGVYCVSIGRSKRNSGRLPVSIICTLRLSKNGDMSDGELQDPNSDCGPIMLSYQGNHTVLRPWNPSTCVFAAGVQNRLVHFPIRPCNKIFVIGAPLQTLSHLADILGPTGMLIAVLQKGDPNGPSQKDISKFLMRHRHAWLVEEEIEKASLEKYEMLLSLPKASKYALLMGTHERLGADSPLRLLDAAGIEGRKDILKLIFDFVEFPEVRMRALVVCHCPPGTSVDAFWELTSNHMDIVQAWRSLKAKQEKAGKESGSGGSSGDEDKAKKKESAAEADEHRGQLWVVLDLPTNNLVASDEAQYVNAKLSEVEARMKLLRNGQRTGLHAKEHLLLPPYFPDHALLLLKYAPHRDERRGDVVARRSRTADKERGDKSATSGTEANRAPAPLTSSMPVPKFGVGLSIAAPAPEPSVPSVTPFQVTEGPPGLPGPPGLEPPPPSWGSPPVRAPPVAAAPNTGGQGRNSGPHGQQMGDQGHRHHQQRYSDANEGYDWEGNRQYGGMPSHSGPDYGMGQSHQWPGAGKGPSRGMGGPPDQSRNMSWGGPAGGGCKGDGKRGGPPRGQPHGVQQQGWAGYGGGDYDQKGGYSDHGKGGYSDQNGRGWGGPGGHHMAQDYHQQVPSGYGPPGYAPPGMPSQGGPHGHLGHPQPVGQGFSV